MYTILPRSRKTMEHAVSEDRWSFIRYLSSFSQCDAAIPLPASWNNNDQRSNRAPWWCPKDQWWSDQRKELISVGRRRSRITLTCHRRCALLENYLEKVEFFFAHLGKCIVHTCNFSLMRRPLDFLFSSFHKEGIVFLYRAPNQRLSARSSASLTTFINAHFQTMARPNIPFKLHIFL